MVAKPYTDTPKSADTYKFIYNNTDLLVLLLHNISPSSIYHKFYILYTISISVFE
jgi:hypothetical protein